MIIKPEDLQKHKDKIGSKALNLKILMDLGLDVPDFLVISNENIKNIFEDSNFREKLVSEIIEELDVEKYVVRSSALIEDSDEESFAGQFQTEIDVSSAGLSEAIVKVINQANNYLDGELNKFSIIIQEFIEPDISGVCFTRNPNGEREFVLEYFKGRGEELVSGNITPIKASFYHSEKIPNGLPVVLQKVVDDFKKFEKYFKFPQDIEWCIQGGKFWFLQTRPITTVSNAKFEEAKYLDSYFEKEDKFKICEKNGLYEICPRPNEFMQRLLKDLYKVGGPVENVYKKYGVVFQQTDFMKIIGEELFIDKNLELRSLLLSFEYKKQDVKRAVMNWDKNLFKTLKNIFKLQTIKPNEELISELRSELEQKLKQVCSNSFDRVYKDFLKEYEIIFHINFLAEKALTDLQLRLKREGVGVSEILNKSFGEKGLIVGDIDTSLFIGNSLDITDTSDFISGINNKIEKSEWFENLPDWKQKYFGEVIIRFQKLNNLREYGRWLTVKYMSALRRLASDKQKSQVKKVFELPNIITSEYVEQKSSGPIVLSSGSTEGILVTKDTIQNYPDQKVILYSQNLTPDLTKYFDRVEGIVSEKGGLLSHLAIVAREKGLPVVSGVRISLNNHMGSKISFKDFY